MAKVTQRNCILKAKIEKANARIQRAAEEAEEAAELRALANATRKANKDLKEFISTQIPKQLMSLQEASEALIEAITTAVQGSSSALFIASPGLGKTQVVMRRLAQIDPKTKVLFVTQSHALAEQCEKVFRAEQKQLALSGEIPEHFETRSTVTMFKGKQLMCEVPELAAKKQGPSWKDCQGCMHFEEGCNYSHQFEAFGNVRFMTLNEMYHTASRFNSMSRPKAGEWVPDVVIVDDHTFRTQTTMLRLHEDIPTLLKDYHSEEWTADILEKYRSAFDELIGEMESVVESALSQLEEEFDVEVEAAAKFDMKVLKILRAARDADKALLKLDGRDEGFVLTEVPKIHSRFKKSKFIWLDGTANAELFRSVHPEAEVYEYHAAKSPKVKQYQVMDSTFSKSAFRKNPEKIEELINWIVETCTDRGYQDIGIISYKTLVDEGPLFAAAIADEVRSRLAMTEQHVKCLHFGNTRGSNIMENCDAIFVIGRQMMRPSELRGMVFALYGEEYPTDRVIQPIGYRVRDEEGERFEAVITSVFKSPEVRAVHEHISRAETVQAGGRIRPYHSTKKKDLYMVTSEPLGENFELDGLLFINRANRVLQESNLLRGQSEESIEKSIASRGTNYLLMREEWCEKLRESASIPDTKAAFMERGIAVRVATKKALRHELALDAGFELTKVEEIASQGRKVYKPVWRRV